MKVFATRGSDGLAREVCGYLQKRLPKKLQPDRHLTLGMVNIEEFSNENIFAQGENVRDHFVIIVHTQTPPVNKGIIELFHLIDAINNAQAADILIVFPYMPYARSDKKDDGLFRTLFLFLEVFAAVELAVDVAQSFTGDMGINLSTGNAAVAKEFLDHSYVHALIKKIGSH